MAHAVRLRLQVRGRNIDGQMASRIIMSQMKIACIFIILILFLTPHSQILDDRGEQTLLTEGRQQNLQTNFTQLDQDIQNLVNRWNLPGAQAAVMYNGTLVFQQSYGMSDTALQIPVQNNDRFRIASLSKAITSAAILTLIENGSLSLDDKMVDLIPHLLPDPLEGCPYPIGTREWSIGNITVSHLLNHNSGLETSPDVTYSHWSWWSGEIELWQDPCIDHVGLRTEYNNGTLAPITMESVIREWLRQSLIFEPGNAPGVVNAAAGFGWDYSNLGYSILGQIIETISGTSYESYVNENVLSPMNITGMQIGMSQLIQRAQNEVIYYDWENDSVSSHYPNGTGDDGVNASFDMVPQQYGGSFVLEEKDGSGAWISTAADYAKFISHIDGTLETSSFNNPFDYFVTNPYDSFGTISGHGVFFTSQSNQSWGHAGAFSGTSTRFDRELVNGEPVVMVLFTNTRPTGNVSGITWGNDRIGVMDSVFTTIDYTNLTCVLGETAQILGSNCTCSPVEASWDCTPPDKIEWPEITEPDLNKDPALNPPPEGNTTEQNVSEVPSISLVAMLSIIGLVAIMRRGRIDV